MTGKRLKQLRTVVSQRQIGRKISQVELAEKITDRRTDGTAVDQSLVSRWETYGCDKAVFEEARQAAVTIWQEASRVVSADNL